MIKFLNLESTDLVSMETDEEYYRVLNIIKDKRYNNIFKYDGDTGIFFKKENEEKVEQILGVSSQNAYSLSEYIEGFSNSESIKLGYTNLAITECISELQNNIETYEERIYNAKDIDKEISKILKEQVPIVFKEELQEERERIDNITNGNFEWD